MSRKVFQPGNDGHGGGRRAGSRNKLQTDFLEALASDFAEHGAGVIRIARVERPTEYLKIVASLMPREMVLEQSVLADISDEDLAAHISVLQRLRARSIDATPDPAPADETKH